MKYEIESSSLIVYIQASVFDSESFKLGVQRIIKLLPLCSLGGPETEGQQVTRSPRPDPARPRMGDQVDYNNNNNTQWMCIVLN